MEKSTESEGTKVHFFPTSQTHITFSPEWIFWWHSESFFYMKASCNKHHTWNVPLHWWPSKYSASEGFATRHSQMACLLCGPLAFLAFMQVTHKRFLDSVGRMPQHITTRVAHRHEGSHEQTLCHSHTISMELLTTRMTRFLSSADRLLAQSVLATKSLPRKSKHTALLISRVEALMTQ